MQVEETTDAGIPMNFLKTAMQNRFLSVVCPKDWDIKLITLNVDDELSGFNMVSKCFKWTPNKQELYEDEKEVWDDIQTLVAKDFGRLGREGVLVEGHHVYPILLGLKADWSYHVSWTMF